MINWKKDYETGITQIDDQHKKLLEIAGSALTLLKNDLYIDKYDEIIAILEELKDYTIYHFNSEEEYMLSVGYKKFLSHKVEHVAFIEKINNIDLNNLDRNQDKALLGILEFVINWIDDHILKKDKLIAG
ncbi:hemerythrin family protein|uniref:Hemerythrin n=1 Tax=Dendrosporobacter quercicolus TaxID=146817 RepID=A0A1G9ZZ84_9FIRM|nr:bacteriohemerythrin [Dendrosporobacter quercicolus]NSL50081.1 hemerythrin family protein [Dendrosporobacter quercicolus DSM 1736]SDN26407.1 hemerythrin [Dendrosporobacter quercicolus]